jgi:hypothetical protein
MKTHWRNCDFGHSVSTNFFFLWAIVACYFVSLWKMKLLAYSFVLTKTQWRKYDIGHTVSTKFFFSLAIGASYLVSLRKMKDIVYSLHARQSRVESAGSTRLLYDRLPRNLFLLLKTWQQGGGTILPLPHAWTFERLFHASQSRV